ncbi:MAG: DUF523 domain-containing protein [Bacillota bacterium]|nr:DUF523 domain-containing protein [Bacillota bacterium]
MIIVSGCLVGKPCKYNGRSNYDSKVVDFLLDKDYILVCPETMGGLESPRPPAEIQGDRVVDAEGVDRTAAFHKGAHRVLAKAKEYGAELCILKESSPSCGVHTIYDGTFTGRKIPGMGLTAELLKENGYRVISEKDI